VGEAAYMLNLLAQIEIVCAIVWFCLSDGAEEMLATIFVAAVKIGVFVMLITNLTDLSNTFADSVVELGLLVGGSNITVDQFKNPSTIMTAGLTQLFTPIYVYVSNLGMLSFLKHVPQIVTDLGAGLLGWFAFLIIGLLSIFTWVELWIVTSVAIILLPFGIFRHTSFIGESILAGVVSAGIRVGVLACVCSLIFPVLSSLYITDTKNIGYDTALACAGAALLFCLIAWQVPKYCAALAGAPVMSGIDALAAGARAGVHAASWGAGKAMGAMRGSSGGKSPMVA
jgi:type IV secretion system protein TrbL